MDILAIGEIHMLAVVWTRLSGGLAGEPSGMCASATALAIPGPRYRPPSPLTRSLKT